MDHKNAFLRACADLLALDRLTHVVDVGANPIDMDQPYRGLLDAGLCRLTGFEPQDAARQKLLDVAGPNERYLPFALGDGGQHVLNICHYSGWTSLLTPSPRALEAFPYYKKNAEVIAQEPLQTHRMDDIAELGLVDFLKIDVQGSELTIFQNAQATLKDVVVLQTEVSVALLYENQPSWSELDSELRSHGLIPFCIVASKPYNRIRIEGRPVGGRKQLLEADVLYVRDYTRPDLMSKSQLGHGALLMHALRAYDLAYHLFQLMEQRGDVAEGAAQKYADLLWNAREWADTIP